MELMESFEVKSPSTQTIYENCLNSEEFKEMNFKESPLLEDFQEREIVVLKSLLVKVTYNGKMNSTAFDEGFPIKSMIASTVVNLTITAPGQNETKFLSISNEEFAPEPLKRGQSITKTKQGTPLGSVSGRYALKLYSEAKHSRLSSLGVIVWDFVVYPSLQVYVDDVKVPVIDITYSIAQQSIQDTWFITANLS